MVYVCNYSNLLSHQRSKKRGINCLNKMFAIWMQKLEAVSQSFLKNLYSIKNLQTEWFWPVRLRDIKFCLKTSTRARSALKMVESGITWSWLTSIYSFKKKIVLKWYKCIPFLPVCEIIYEILNKNWFLLLSQTKDWRWSNMVFPGLESLQYLPREK